MRAVVRWIDERTGLGSLVRSCLDARIPGEASWCRVWPAAIGFAFCVQLITGLFIWMYYSPGAQTAWESVYYLQHEVVGGWLLRAVHHWSGQVLLVLLVLYLIQTVVTGAYRAPRELTFWTALLMLLVTLGLLLTGDLLAWDQNSYASTQTRVNFLQLLPWVGGGLWKLAVGGPQFGHLTLTRFLVLHVCCFSGSFLLLLLLHVVLGRRADAASAVAAHRSVRFWPRQAVRNAAAMAVVLVVILWLCGRHGVRGDDRGLELGSPADTSSFFSAARPEWAFRGLYQFARLFPGGKVELLPIYVIPGLLVLIGLAMPWIARCRGGHRFNLAFTGALLVGVTGLSCVSLWQDANDQQHQAVLKADAEHARRAVQLARLQGIPPTGALTLLRNDPKTQGPILFETHCSSCHSHVDARQQGIRAEEPSAPNLYGYATRDWVGGWLDLERIRSADYFGNTKFRRGQMVQNLEVLYDEWEDEPEELRQDLAAVVAALSAEAKLSSQEGSDATDVAMIAKGRALIEEIGCTDCHKFYAKGRLGVGPELTGYGSRGWTMAIIADPAARRFYHAENDRMPSYAEFPDEPARNVLGTRQIELLSDWLRGEWRE